MKKRILSVLLCLCMVVAILPTAVLAVNYANDTYNFRVRVAGHEFATTENAISYWTCSNNTLTTANENDTWNVKYDPTTSGVPTVTLQNFSYTGSENAIRSQGDLNVELKGTNTITNNKSGGSSDVDSFDRNGIMVKGDLTITGSDSATLSVTSTNGNAIEANDFSDNNDSGVDATRYNETLTIKDANITANGYGLGIGSTENLIIINSTIHSIGTEYHGLQGGYYTTQQDAFGYNGTIRITNSTITAITTNGTALKTAPVVTSDHLWETTGTVDNDEGWQTLSDTSKPDYSTAKTVRLKPGTGTQSILLENDTFSYAYDAQRTPTYPSKDGTLEMSNLAKPIIDDNTTRKDTNTGTWTLTRVGTYSYVKNNSGNFSNANSTYLNGVVSGVANKYTELTTDAIVIHELKDNGTHIAYGVVLAYDVAGGYAVFLGDKWSSSGACYLLSVSSKSGSFNATAGTIATDFVQSATYGISLTPAALSFDSVEYGYSAPEAKSVTVTNTGNAATGALTVALTAGDITAFEVSSASISDIATGSTATFTVQPKTGLAAGTYTATVTVSGENIVSQSFAVTFTVNPAPVVIPTSYRISVAATENGTVTSNRNYAYGGSTITLTATPDEGCELDELVVTDAAGRELDVTDKGDGTYTFKMPYGNVKVAATFVATEPEPEPEPDPVKDCPKDDTCIAAQFTDVDLNAWYHDGIHYCLDNGLMQGTGDDIFEPDGPTSRAMLVTVLYRLEGEPEVGECPFSDVPEDEWYTDAVIWAAENGIVEGYEGKFEPEANITREAFATILYRYAVYQGYDVSVGEETNILSFDDAEKIDDWAMEAMQWAVGAGLFEGKGENNLDPTGKTTRAEMAAILYRFCENVAE